MARLPLIIDCDPGVDDFIAILMALGRPDAINLLGITTVAGNVPLPYTYINALRACRLVGREDVPVYAGCPRPLLRDLVSETVVHGDSGLGDCVLPMPSCKPSSQHAVDFLIETFEHKQACLAATGPLTNIALALIKAPHIKKNIQRIVTMGGSMALGNITPQAEYNYFCDPHAAQVVYTSGVPIVMAGLHLTHQVVATPEWISTLPSSPVGGPVKEMLSYFQKYDAAHFETGGGGLHDPCVLAYILEASLFQGKHVHVTIEDTGRSTIDWWGKTTMTPNAYVINKVDAEGFFSLLTTILESYEKPPFTLYG